METEGSAYPQNYQPPFMFRQAMYVANDYQQHYQSKCLLHQTNNEAIIVCVAIGWKRKVLDYPKILGYKPIWIHGNVG